MITGQLEAWENLKNLWKQLPLPMAYSCHGMSYAFPVKPDVHLRETQYQLTVYTN